MKQISILTILLIFTLTSFSQITITAGDNSFSIGDNALYYKVFGADNFDPGASGEEVIWDYSDLEEDGGTNEFDYLDPNGKPHVDIMPDPDVAEQLNSGNNGYFYFDHNGNTQWNRSGFYTNNGQGTEIWLAYDGGPLQLYPNDFTYLTSHDVVPFSASGGYTAAGVTEEAQIPNAAEYHFDCDGYGTLILPHKIYQNALRVHVTEEFQIQLLIMGSPVITMNVNDDAYYWFVEDVQGPVLSYVVSESSSRETTYTLQWQKPYDALECDFIATNPTTGNEMTTGNTDSIFKMMNLSYPLNNDSNFEWEFSPNTVEYVNSTSATSVHPEVRFTEAGTYTATLTITNSGFTPNTETITKTDYITVDQAPMLEADFSADNTEPNSDEAVNFTATVNDEDGSSYLWEITPGVNGTHYSFTNFSSETDKDPQITFYEEGCYSIQLTVTNNNYSNSPVVVTKTDYISVDGGCGSDVPGNKNSDINIYPNPNNGIFRLNNNNSINIKIYNVQGKLIYQKAQLKNQQIDLSKHQKGIYIIEANNKGNIIHEKLIIK